MNHTLRKLLSRLLGSRGEDEAAQYLRRQGLRVLVRGYRTPWGEVDLIARDGDTLVFVEVKARKKGEPAAAVTLEKQRRLTLAALRFLKENALLEQRCRFDVVAITWPDSRCAPAVEHLRDAFEAVGHGQMFR